MNKFIFKTLIFLSIVIIIIILGVITPPTPNSTKSLLFAKIKKDSLLETVALPRIIFVGGSNLSFGLNSKTIKDSLKLNPINTAIHGSIGLVYMMQNTIKYVKSGDIVVVVPEYSQFYNGTAYGGEELLRTILDIQKLELLDLKEKQFLNIYKYIPKYSLQKLKPNAYFNLKESTVYSVNSFNEYGDAYKHWELEKQDFDSYNSIIGEFDYSIIEELNQFKTNLTKKGALLLISYPGFESTSFNNCIKKINKVEIELKAHGFNILGTPKRYKIPDSLMFNTAYHLSKDGVDLRTRLLIEDLKSELQSN